MSFEGTRGLAPLSTLGQPPGIKTNSMHGIRNSKQILKAVERRNEN